MEGYTATATASAGLRTGNCFVARPRVATFCGLQHSITMAMLAEIQTAGGNEQANSAVNPKLKPLNYQYNYKTQFGGCILALFALYSLRIIICPWLWHGSGLDVFLPIISPVYRQAEHWHYWLQSLGVILHVSFGALTLCTATLQLDKTIRHQYPHIHRWCGRLYALSGVISIYSLQLLRDSAGAGSAPRGHSEALALFIDVTSVLWLILTTIGIVTAMCKNFALHRDAIVFSVGLAAVPIAQRLFSWILLTPVALTLRVMYCATPSNIPWHTRWGPPGSSSSLLWGSCDTCVMAQSADPRACPLVFSLDGYGEGEQACFAASAWAGLVAICLWGTPRLLTHATRCSSVSLTYSLAAAHGSGSQNTTVSDAEILGNWTYADIWRNEGKRIWLALSGPTRFINNAVTILCPAQGGIDVIEGSWARKYLRRCLLGVSRAIGIVMIVLYLAFVVSVAAVLLSLATFIVTISTVACVAVIIYVLHAVYYTVPPPGDGYPSLHTTP